MNTIISNNFNKKASLFFSVANPLISDLPNGP